MIANEYAIPLQLAATGMVNSLTSDSCFEPYEYSKVFRQDYGIAQDFHESMHLPNIASDQQKLENNLTNTLSVFHLSPAMQINRMPPPPHSVYVNSYRHNNNNINTKTYNKRGGWKHHSHHSQFSIPQGYDSDENCKSHSSRDVATDNSTKPKISRNGYGLPYEHTAVNTNYRYNNNYTDSFGNAIPIPHYHHGANGFNKRFSTNSSKRPRRDHKHHHADDIDRRLHGLMERFTSKAKLFQIIPFPKSVAPTQLDQSIWDLFTAKTQTEATYFRKLELWKKVYLHISKLFDRYGLFMVGSTMSGLGIENSDMDVCLLLRTSTNDPRTDAVRYLEMIRNLLQNCNHAVGSCILVGRDFSLSEIPTYQDGTDCQNCLRICRLKGIAYLGHILYSQGDLTISEIQFGMRLDFVRSPEVIHAKVPILKFRSAEYGFEVDLNCNNSVGIRNTHLLHCYTQLDWRVRPLIIIVKLWAQANNINNAKNMTISSYSLALMVIHFLQCGVTPPVVPCLHGLYPEKFNPEKEIHEIDIQEELSPFLSDNNQTLGELLLGFLQYYSYFNYKDYGISVRLASRILIDECRLARSQKNDPNQWKHLCIEEPFDFTNTARSVYDLQVFHHILKVFQDSFNVLNETRNLSCILMNIDVNQR